MTSSPIRLVCFDLGGVLIRICRSWTEGCAAAGLPIRANGSAPGADTIPGWHDLIVQYQTGRIDAARYAENLSAAMNGLYSPEEILAVHHAWMFGQYDGVTDVIDRIHAVGLDTAALSNTNHEHWLRMEEFSAVMRLRTRLASHILGLHKPDPAIYLAAERQFAVRGPSVLFFDDLPENIDAARAVGWNAVQVDPHRATASQIIEGLAQFGVQC